MWYTLKDFHLKTIGLKKGEVSRGLEWTRLMERKNGLLPFELCVLVRKVVHNYPSLSSFATS
jgi:hypothetical protein